ncbi:hypothetical protein DSN97_02160 [Deferribacteraceae bacterium V6Fe1]|nr:hypothetical protein DSN97_02160 [Deferribacteraceae bacterium V6Fe1]
MKFIVFLWFTFLPALVFSQTLGSGDIIDIATSSGVSLIYYNSASCSFFSINNCNNYVLGGINQKGTIGYATTSHMPKIVKRELGIGHVAGDLNISQRDAGADNISGWSDL